MNWLGRRHFQGFCCGINTCGLPDLSIVYFTKLCYIDCVTSLVGWPQSDELKRNLKISISDIMNLSYYNGI
jgi:hypothetical protein